MSVNTLTRTSLSQILKKHESELVSEWVRNNRRSRVTGDSGQRV